MLLLSGLRLHVNIESLGAKTVEMAGLRAFILLSMVRMEHSMSNPDINVELSINIVKIIPNGVTFLINFLSCKNVSNQELRYI